jgi:glycosyltransferase involved in cell wall biosynthesis
MKKFRYLFFIPSTQLGGSEKVLITIHNELIAKGYDSYITFLSTGNIYNQIKTTTIKNSRSLNYKKTRYAIFSIIREVILKRPKVVVSSSHHLNPFIALTSLFGVMVILREPASNYYRERNKNKIQMLLTRFFVISTYRLSKYIVFQNQLLLDEFVAIYSSLENRCVVINNPVKIEQVNNSLRNPFDKSKFNILGVGSLKQSKRFDILIYAVNHITDMIPNIHLTILGDGPLNQYLKNLVSSLNMEDTVTFAGFSPNTLPYYTYCDLFVLSSEREGFPNTLLEAAVNKCKIISTDCNYGPRILLGNDYRSLVETNNPIKMGMAILNEYSLDKISYDISNYLVTNVVDKYISLVEM